jgi:5,10-methylenetetrahydrofolate reductase
VTVEVVTPAPDDAGTAARILTLARAIVADDRIAALTLTDRTTAGETTDVVALATAVADASGKTPLVHIAGKGRTQSDLVRVFGRLRDAGLKSVLLTSGDPLPGSLHQERCDAVTMIATAARVMPDSLIVGVVAPRAGRPLDEAYGDAATKRTAATILGAESAPAMALVAQVSWDLGARETIAGWQARLGVPILGAVMPLTRGRLAFLAAHRITGIHVPPALRRRVEDETPEAARQRLALDLVVLRRLGYAGAHLSALLTPALVIAALDEADRLDAALGDDWRRSCY